ncbi:MAG: ribosome small subunit-dependent GTPase A [Prevotellaceae bacterium]|nr:ribosome small subunit-dependent GTPase A [Prevotellaceae bacterium]
MKALVIKNTGSWYVVKTDDGKTMECKIKGNFRLRGIRSTNPIAVGDYVDVRFDEQQQVGLITEIYDRKNYIIRKSINLSKQSHIIAANVDQAFLVVTISHPATSTTFVDRFLASAEAYRIPVILLFNKGDILTDEETHLQQMMMTLYETIGYKCMAVSAATGEGIDAVRALLEGKVSVFSGHSGVGKSTLLNHFIDGRVLKTAEISEAHDAGMHTTTFSEMIEVANATNNTYVIDTPGIKGFGTFDMEKEELTSYFKEIFHYSKDCRFSNCTHTHEPGCAVLKALEDHLIAQSRYNSYLSMLDDKDEDRYRASY